uniref:C-type lectin domain-containing protein n=1 Tax=Xiphophorus maculatus TaxID=8083 RepID=A0A3B5REA9_XIPMA
MSNVQIHIIFQRTTTKDISGVYFECYHLLKFVFIVPGLCFLPLCFSQVYHVVNERKSWTEAQRYCRETYTDLVTINSTEAMAQVKDILRDKTDEFWIGLYGDVNNWKWSLEKDGFYEKGQADLRLPCSNTYPFICSGESNIPGERCVQLAMNSVEIRHAQ